MGNTVSQCLSHMSIVLNGWLTGDVGYPLCYTAYDRKNKFWCNFFDTAMFWDKQHCRKVWLRIKIYERNNEQSN